MRMMVRMVRMMKTVRMNTLAVFLFISITTALLHQTQAFPTPPASQDKAEFDRQLTEERPLQQQIAEADSESKTEPKPTQPSEFSPDDDDITLLKSLAERSRELNNETPKSDSTGDHHTHEDTDSTKNRRLADDYDTTKNGIDSKYQGDPESLHQLDGTPLTAEDIVQKIANKIYEEDDRGVFDRIVSKLLKLGLITHSQADTLEVEVAEALQDLITKNAKNNEIQELNDNNKDEEDSPSRRFDDGGDDGDGGDDDDDVNDGGDDDDDDDDDVGDEEQEEEIRDADGNWDGVGEGNDRNEVNPEDELQDLQYFPNFYRLLRSLDSEQDAEERETLITIMKTLIDFVKMMVKYGTITPEEGVSYLENLDNMIATQTKNKLGKALGPLSITPPTAADEDDNTKEETAKMLREYENLKDSTKDERMPAENGKSESYLEAIRKNIEWLKKHNKDENKEDYDLSKLRDFMDQQVDTYIEKGILKKDEGDVIKRIYGSL
ncbi:secretogranin-3 [Ictalurus punctatus]|uniref:Secretogranin-3 n=1 Tax=Ictalurus punctatus TaxID=7998 RepID=A0A9F7TGD6_ICTPU|nr:secretogranin-3 [Ictalurus punctatus]